MNRSITHAIPIFLANFPETILLTYYLSPMLPYHYAEMAYLCHVIKNFIFKVSENSQVLFLGLWAGHVCTRKQTIVSAIMRFWFVRDIWSYTSVFWLIDWLIGLLIHSLNHLLGKSQTAVCHPQQQKLSNWCAPIRCVSSVFQRSTQQIDASATTTLYNSTKTARIQR